MPRKTATPADEESLPSDFEYDGDDQNSSAGAFESAGEAESGDEMPSEDSESVQSDSDAMTDDEEDEEEGVFEEGDFDAETLDAAALQRILEEARAGGDDETAIKVIVSVIRAGIAESGPAPYHFATDVTDTNTPLYDALSIWKQSRAQLDGKRSKWPLRFWKDFLGFLQSVSSPHNPTAKAILISLDEVLLESLWSLRRTSKIQRGWARLCEAALALSTPTFCPPLIAGFLKTVNTEKRAKLLVDALRKLLGQIQRRFATRRATKQAVDTGKYFASHVAAILYELQQREMQKHVYMAMAQSIKQLVIQIGQYRTIASRPPSGNPKTVKATKAKLITLHDQVISWGTLFLISVSISLMVLERAGGPAIQVTPDSPMSAHRLAEAILPVLFSLSRLHQNKVTYLPFHTKVLGLCLSLSKATQLYCPLGSLICEFGDHLSICLGGQKTSQIAKKQSQLTKPASLETTLLLPEEQLAHAQFHEAMITAFRDMLIDHLCHIAHHPAFPEIAHVLLGTAAKKFAATPPLSQIVKSVAPVVQSTSEKIVEIRNTLRDATFRGPSPTIHIIPLHDYETFDLVRFASQRPVNSSIFIF